MEQACNQQRQRCCWERMGCGLKMKIVIDIWHFIDFRRIWVESQDFPGPWAYCALPGAVDFQLCCQGSQRLPWSASGAGGQQERGALNLPFSFNQNPGLWMKTLPEDNFSVLKSLKREAYRIKFSASVSVREPNFLIWLSLTLWDVMGLLRSQKLQFSWRPPCSYVSVCRVNSLYCSSSLSFLDTFLINHLPLTRAYTFL